MREEGGEKKKSLIVSVDQTSHAEAGFQLIVNTFQQSVLWTHSVAQSNVPYCNLC